VLVDGNAAARATPGLTELQNRMAGKLGILCRAKTHFR